ncbi:MAG: hypothetical protein JW821_12295 [Deltaproteobacteria bacterium]|nr:hypothetical protein [Deltaproteobacteria bacterium]
MNTRVILPALVLFFLLLPAAFAKTVVHCEVQEVAQHEMLVTFQWKAKVTADKSWDACDLVISFRDAKGAEIHVVRERLKVKKGPNDFSGHDLCEKSIWKQAVKYLATLDCVF